MAMAADDRMSAVPEVAVGSVAAGRQVDPTSGVSVPAWAVVTVGGHQFWCDELEDWRRCLALAGMAGGLIQVPVGIPRRVLDGRGPGVRPAGALLVWPAHTRT
jgi:hypothetical protein